MTDAEKIEWAKRAFVEIATECESVAAMEIISRAEARTWKRVASIARRNIKILEQP